MAKKKKKQKLVSCRSCADPQSTKIATQEKICSICGAKISGFGFEISVEGINAEEVKVVTTHILDQIKNNENKRHEPGNGAKVLSRQDYFQIIIEIRDLERISLENYLEDKYERYLSKNPHFIKILYKDINRVLDIAGKDGNFQDLVIEDGDLVFEAGDIKETGHPTNLDYAVCWLHLRLVEEFINDGAADISAKIESFEKDFLSVNNDSGEYTNKLTALASEIKRERFEKNRSGWKWTDFNELLELKPNIMGIGLNINALLSKFINLKKQNTR